MDFSSDTSAPGHPQILEALDRVNSGTEPSYGADSETLKLKAALAERFETDVEVLPVASGTAANALALSIVCGSMESVICHREAHIERDERGAPEFFTGGGKLHLCGGDHAKLDLEEVKSVCAGIQRGFVHETPPAALSLTNLTESGARYSADETAALAQIARNADLKVHLDGARFANALVSGKETPAALSWQAGVDLMSFGFTKNGALGCELIILFNDMIERFPQLQARAKRSGHLPPKMRFLSAQALAMLEGDLWLGSARIANAKAQAVAEILTVEAGARMAHPVDGNEVFAHMPDKVFERLLSQGLRAYKWIDGSVRFVCHWNTSQKDVDDLAAACRQLT